MNLSLEYDWGIRNKYINQINQLINMADKILETKQVHHNSDPTVRDTKLSMQWKVSSLSLLEDLFSQENSIYQEFAKHVQIAEWESEIIEGQAILTSALRKLEIDLPINLKQLLFYLQNIPSEKRPIGFQIIE